MLALILSLTVLQAQAPDTSAYLDAGARDLVAKARDYRDRVDRSITHYTTRSLERISLGVSALRRDRLMYRREIATKIDWQRDSVPVIEVEGAREVIPVAIPGMHLPEDLDSDISHHAFDPASDRFMLGIAEDDDFFYHPLGRRAEEHYRFRSGDTTRIRLQDGRTLTLATLEIIPAFRDVHHLQGTIWIDVDSHAMVRGVFRLADQFKLGRDVEDDDVPGFLNAITADMKYMTVEYSLWELRWWLPRVLAFEGSASVGFIHFPLRYEMRWDAYEVEGDTTVAYQSRAELREQRLSEEAQDSLREACYERGFCRCEDGECRNFRIVIPEDTIALMTSDRLPASVYAEGETVMTPVEVQALEEALRTGLPTSPWQLPRPTFAWGFSSPGLVRYNRIESLSIGARSGLDLGKLQVEAVGRIGLADWEPNAELRAIRDGQRLLLGLGGFRRLAAMNPDTRPLMLGNSFNSLFFGRDDGEYYRALGAELTVQPSFVGNRSWDARLFYEHQTAAERETDFSVPHVFDGDHLFRDNRPADRADQVGGQLSLRYDRGLNPEAVRWGVEARVLGSTGTFDFARGSIATHLIIPIGRVTTSVEGAAGWSGGTLPVQSLWYLGGVGSLRGYDGAVASGESFYRGRAEIGAGIPGARLALFSDLGWAGPRADFGGDRALLGAGVGGSFLDGLLRIDLSRALRPPTGWRLDLYLDGLI